MLQPEDYEGGTDGALARVQDPAERARFAVTFQHALTHPEDSEAFDGKELKARAYFSATRSGKHVGRSIEEVAADEGVTPGEMAVRLLEAELPDAVMVYKRGVTKEDFDEQVRRTITHPAWTLTSDGLYHGPLPHPRGYGTYVRFLRYAVRELGVLTLPQAVHKASGGVAERLRLTDRGFVREGLAADLVVLDPTTVSEGNDWDDPRLPPTGIAAVTLNGTVVVRGGRATGTLAGRVLRRV
jgi:N-acyl-D-amino-acid deacylase